MENYASKMDWLNDRFVYVGFMREMHGRSAWLYIHKADIPTEISKMEKQSEEGIVDHDDATDFIELLRRSA